MASITRAGENGVLTAGIMAGPKALYARGGTGAKMGSHRLKGILVQDVLDKTMTGAHTAEIKPFNRVIIKVRGVRSKP